MKEFFLTVCFTGLVVLNGFSRSVHVGKGYPFNSVQQGIDAASAGDTVIVHEGLYREGNIKVPKPITLLGVGWPVLDGEKKYEVLSIRSDHVTVQGFKVKSSGHSSLEDMGGIKVYNSRHVLISGNQLDDNFFGVYLQYSQNCIVKDNSITAYATEEQAIGNGIHCWKSDTLQIIGNHVIGHRDGIYFEFVKSSVIWRNISEKNIRYGLHFMFSHDDSYINNIFRNNGAGVAVMFTKNVKMINNTFEDNWGDAAYGLLLKEISDSHIYNNKFLRNTSGIFMEGTNRIILERNTFKDNGWGMKIQASCMENVIRFNNFLRNTFDVSTNGSLVLNKFEHNYWDKYEGYDLDKNNIGDIPYRPLSLFSVIVEKYPAVMLLYRSFIITLMDRSEKIIPTLTPGNFVDELPVMHAYPI